MAVIVILFFCSLLVAGGFLVAFILATRRGQYDDVVTPPHRIMDDE
ncbi:MAG: cbb3-type cytochrome oxidase assembly protein CcoS [Chlorobi bacterium]|nr:MAG: cbb3-type cytochrome oxidase assembly protein CcoS [Bacteroidota bacterium]KXK35060.1 MAG: cbb3-type cytochrome c oxidase maturation protein CcoS [Chlorobi bacterium OLB6]MBE2265588.1 cbb3-type cytochrome oxidase assembly protein CcoS [Flavobacteriales bacterium]MBL1161713.1 cbb3-type cytochrome oxidase assembly protein CcoS [Chlorobiota bacterium]MBW7853926.1 cbb3-type cytochrome oxidase assembly protein CcoS [Candidatus Kapabacteria bacterium]MCC6331803.1 cbb3-type cytochrome oxidase